MHRGVLTLLGCSSSLAVVVLTGKAVKALVPPTFTGVAAPQVETQTVTAPIAQETPQSSIHASTDKVRQLALATFGCTCSNCMNAVRQMVQQGTLSL